jgi:hypothetical protein
MKHLLNNLTEEEKTRIRGQHNDTINIITENFSKLVNTKSGDVKLFLSEDEKLPFKFDHRLIKVTKTGTRVVGLTKPDPNNQQSGIPTNWNGCQGGNTNACIEYPSALPDGVHSQTEGNTTATFYINYKGSKHVCRFDNKPCKKI